VIPEFVPKLIFGLAIKQLGMISWIHYPASNGILTDDELPSKGEK
jgi:hypothetical protein